MNYRPAFPLFPVLVVLLAGCPATRADPGPQDAQPPLAASTVSPAPSAPASAAASAESFPSWPIASAGELPDSGPYTSGGTWATCMKGFRPESTLERDLIRLGMLCGPYHGMRKLGSPLTGKLAAGKAVQHTVQTIKGQCLRAFVIAGDPINGLKLRATASGGTRLAEETTSARWGVLDRQGSWCASEDGAVTIELEAVSGQGDYAMQVWLLP